MGTGVCCCSDADLQLTSTVLKLCNSMLAADPSLAESMATTLLPPALKLVQSTLLQGSALRVRVPPPSLVVQ